MLKKLCVVFVGLGFCLGLMGCGGSKKAQLPKDKVAAPAEKPSASTQKIDPPE